MAYEKKERGYEGRGSNYQRSEKNQSDDQYIENGRIKEGYLKNGYFRIDVPHALNTDLVLKAANEFAQNLFNARPQLKKSQLRKYYNYCKGLQHKMRLRGLGYSIIEADFIGLIGRTKNGLNKAVPRLFVDFIERNTRAVKGKSDYNAFIKHFEMIVAYYPNND